MQDLTVKEYELVREEMHAVKACITTYTGYVLGGSGAAIIGLGTLYQLADANSVSALLLVSGGCLAISLVPPLVYLVLLYKFNSHNRFAAYCKLLGHEKPISSDDWHHVVSWEYCMAQLRACELRPLLWAEAWEMAEFSGKESPLARRVFEKYGPDGGGRRWWWKVVSRAGESLDADPPWLGPFPGALLPGGLYRFTQFLSRGVTWPARTFKSSSFWRMVDLSDLSNLPARLSVDRRGRRDGARVIWECLTGGTHSHSWTFPAHITALFGWITLTFVVTGSVLGLMAVGGWSADLLTLTIPQTSTDWLVAVWLLVVLAQSAVWYLFGVRMHAVLYGSATVNAYAWRFLPIRAAFLRAMDIVPQYVGLEDVS